MNLLDVNHVTIILIPYKNKKNYVFNEAASKDYMCIADVFEVA